MTGQHARAARQPAGAGWRQIFGSALFREIAAIRTDSAWRMLGLHAAGKLPARDEEGATGAFDNRGAMFVPGGLVFEDSDRRPVSRQRHGVLSERAFRRRVRAAMRLDNATLVFPDGLAVGVNLNNGFFAEVSGNILAYRQAALKRRPTLERRPPPRIDSDALTRSHVPTYIEAPYGSRTRLSSCLAACLVEPRMYYVLCRSKLALRSDLEKQRVWDSIRQARQPVEGKDGTILAAPHIVVCHTTRHGKDALCGITRILGIGKFGAFANFTLERVSGGLRRELGRGDRPLSPGDLFAEDHGVQVAGVLRTYARTRPGRRPKKTEVRLLRPAEDLGLDVEQIAREAVERYGTPQGCAPA